MPDSVLADYYYLIILLGLCRHHSESLRCTWRSELVTSRLFS